MANPEIGFSRVEALLFPVNDVNTSSFFKVLNANIAILKPELAHANKQSPLRNIIPDRRQSKTLILSTNGDQKLQEKEFSIAICRPTGDNWKSKTLFLSIFDSRSLTVKSLFDCRLSGMSM